MCADHSLSALANDPLLVWNYGVVAVLAGVTGVIFWFSIRHLDAKEDQLNNLDTGHVDPNADPVKA
jgi:proton-dependent oligopeptide transporter, POT family